MTKAKAVLTGDLIGSTKAGPAATDRAMDALASAAHEVSFWVHADTRFTRYRGDGWQMYLHGQPGLVFRVCIFLAARLRNADTGLASRFAAGIGSVNHVGSTSLSDANGEAFEISGRALDTMERKGRMTIGGDGVTPWHEALFEIADWMIRRWSREQAEAAALALEHDGASMAELAERIGVTRQAFESRLAGSGLRALETALWVFDNETFLPAPPP
jgi:hypothetical protein